MTTLTSRDEEIRLIWHEHQWLYMIVGFIVGVVFCLLIQLSIHNLSELVLSLFPEATSIIITILVIDRLNRRRDERNAIKQLKEQLVRDASSMVNDVANNAIHQMTRQDPLDNWLIREQGLLVGANLWKANLQNAELVFANLRNTVLVQANLQHANLRMARLQHAELVNTNLRDANLITANLQHANLLESKLQRANLWGANLQHANFFVANLQDANLQEAKLQGALLVFAKLQGVNLYKAEFDETTTLPDGNLWKPGTDMERFTNPNRPDFYVGTRLNDE